MTATAKEPFCQFHEDQIKESGLLSPERYAVVEAAVTARMLPCFYADGTQIPHAVVARTGATTGRIVAQPDENMVSYLRRLILPAVLTASELDTINEYCLAASCERRDAERFEKAEKLNSWDGGVFYGDEYHSSIEDLISNLATGDEDDSFPKYVWAAEGRQVVDGLTVSDVTENAICNNGWEDMDSDDLNGGAELQAALDKFVEANASVISYQPDYTKAILLADFLKEEPAQVEKAESPANKA